jgi:hypothetical protein
MFDFAARDKLIRDEPVLLFLLEGSDGNQANVIVGLLPAFIIR